MVLVLETGRTVAGRYRLDQLLGQGGMGEVWAATHTVTRRSVAMKFVKGTSHARPELRRRFMREARAASAVRHPNVVEVFDVFELDAETPVMVMELLTGETLARRLSRDGQLPLDDALAVLLPAVSAVGTAHALGVVHRDLKPDNLFLAGPAGSAQGETVVKVLDFGIAKLSSALSGETGVTETGTTLGTPCYMAPEQAMAERELDHRVDVWAFGVILYETLSGARPIEGDTVGQVVKHLMTTGITPLERVVPGLPDSLTALVARMLARERNRRPEDLREVFEVLQALTDVRARSFGAPGSEAPSPAEIEALSSSGDALVLDPKASAIDPAASTVRVDTAGPHAVSSKVDRRPSNNWLLGTGALAALGAGVVVYSLTRPAREPATSSPPSTAIGAAAIVPPAPSTHSPVPSVHLPAETASPAASASAASPEHRAGRAPKRGSAATNARDGKNAAPTASGSAAPPTSATRAETPPAAASPPPGSPAAKRPVSGGLAEQPPF